MKTTPKITSTLKITRATTQLILPEPLKSSIIVIIVTITLVTILISTATTTATINKPKLSLNTNNKFSQNKSNP